LRLAAGAALSALLAALASAPAALAQTPPTPKPTATPLTVSGFFRSYYFTRQNATNNPGVQFDYSTGKCNGAGPCVNQASLNTAVDLHADYAFGGGWHAGGSYFYAQPFSGPCSTAVSHARGAPCVSQNPPNTNPDDTLPGFALSTFPEAYLGYKMGGFSAILGDQLFVSPWAAPYDGSRLKPAAYQGGDFEYDTPAGLKFELADMLQFENRTSNTFQSNTMLTSHPAGAAGVPNEIYVPGGGSITTGGFFYARAGYAPKDRSYAFNGYVYDVSDIATMWWFDGKYTFSESGWRPFVAMQGGFEYNSGTSVLGKIDSSVIGVRVGFSPNKRWAVDLSADSIPWRTSTVSLPAPVRCSNDNYQISAGNRVYPGTTFPYFLPVDAGQCSNNRDGTTTIYYGGWASPYTDSYSSDPLFTTQISQGMADRRSPGSSWRVSATYTSENKRVVFVAGDAWFDYGNQLVGQFTNEWTLDAMYRFNPATTDRYKGWFLRYRYAQRTQSNTFCGVPGTTCPPGLAPGATYLGGLPIFKYNRAQLEYDF
jgi:hypothetical protein